MIIGGIAILARGVRRMTTDVDVVVRGDAVEASTLVEAFERVGVVGRIPDALAFAASSLVLLLVHERSGVELDVSLAWTAFEHEALAARTPARFGGLELPMATAEDLVVFKAIAARPKDLDDAETLLVLYPDIDVERVRRIVRQLAAAAEADHVPKLLEAVLARAGKDGG
jgi:hypothetical protein